MNQLTNPNYEPQQQTINLSYDKPLTVATGNNRRTKRWTNKEMNWSDFLTQLNNPVRTPETFKQYQVMSLEDKGDAKDVGGFVGGALAEGRRLASKVNWRSMVTLDFDNVTGDIWGTFEALYPGVAGALYSTHSHTPEAPRVRLIVPLSDNVTPDQYQPIARRIAADIGIDQADKTTYQPERLMFWPSHSSDAEYIFKYQDGQFLPPGAILQKFTNWADPYGWPYADDELVNTERLQKQQGDPLSKKGFVGAFNRAYTIPEVMAEFLPGEYEPFTEDRFTYLNGSTAGGLILYNNDTFAYSHHGTSPTSGELTNAFDFLRLHLFRDQDLDAAPKTPANRMPSYIAVKDLVKELPRVKQELTPVDDLPFTVIDDGGNSISPISTLAPTSPIVPNTGIDFSSSLSEGLEGGVASSDTQTIAEAKAWLGSLTRDERGQVESSGKNIMIILENDPNLKGRIKMDIFSRRLTVTGRLPWARITDGLDDWADTDDGSLATYLEFWYGVVGNGKIENAVNEVALKNKYHPVRDYLNSLEWDGTQRLQTLLIDYFAASDSPYTRKVTEMHFVASVARVFQPGVKYDTALILVGSQGLAKSSFISKMANGWFNDSLLRVDNKDAYEGLQGTWHIELAEMSAARRSDTEAIKHFLSKQEDKYRPSYGKRTITVPREVVFWGSTNRVEFLKDTTGNRRFLPIKAGRNPVKRVYEHLSKYEIDQAWAEALVLYKAGYDIYLDSEMSEIARVIVDNFTEESPMAADIRSYLETLIPGDWYQLSPGERRMYLQTGGYNDNREVGQLYERDRVCVKEVWAEALGEELKDITRADSREINDILDSLSNWERSESGISFGAPYNKQRGFIRIE